MSFSQTSIRPRLLFGRFVQAYCKREDRYYKSTLDLNRFLGNNNGTFSSNLANSHPLNTPYDIDSNIHLHGSNIVGDLPTRRPGRNRAIYDLDVCLSNADGELKWVKHDGLLARDGIITKAVEAIPGVGFIMALFHYTRNNTEHAKRASIMSGKGLFVILFGIIASSAVFAIAAMSFLGTIIADLTIESAGRAWVKDKRIAAEIPNRTWKNIIIDGFIAGAAAGAATSIAPHAEVAAAGMIRATVTVPEEIAVAEIEMLSMQNLIHNGSKVAREIIKAITGGTVRATSAVIQEVADGSLQTRGSGVERSSSFDTEFSEIKPGYYYISNFQTGQLLQFTMFEDGLCIQASEGHFKNSQLWALEKGNVGYRIRAYFPDTYIGHHAEEGSTDLKPCIVALADAVEFKVEGGHREGLVFLPITNTTDELALSVGDSENDHTPVVFTSNRGAKQQRWMLEEGDGVDVLEFHKGPLPTNAPLQIRDATKNVLLKLPLPPQKWYEALLTTAVVSDAEWVLEAGFNGYFIKHIASRLYIAIASEPKDIKIRSLILCSVGTEFLLSGDDDSGYSIIHAADPKYGMQVDEHDSNSTAFLSWQPDDNHAKWHVKVKSN